MPSKTLKIDWDKCDKQCDSICGSVISDFILKMEKNGGMFTVQDVSKVLNMFEVKIFRVQSLCPKGALRLE